MFLKLSKAAEMLDVHKDTLRRYIRKGLIKAQKLPSGHYRVEESNVRALLERTISDEVDSLLEGMM